MYYLLTCKLFHNSKFSLPFSQWWHGWLFWTAPALASAAASSRLHYVCSKGVYIHTKGSDYNIPEDTLTAQDSFRSSRQLELCQSGADRFTVVNDEWCERQEVQIYGSSHTQPFLGEWRWGFWLSCKSFYSLLFVIVTLMIINVTETSDSIWRWLKPWKTDTLTFFLNLFQNSTGADLKPAWLFWHLFLNPWERQRLRPLWKS